MAKLGDYINPRSAEWDAWRSDMDAPMPQPAAPQGEISYRQGPWYERAPQTLADFIFGPNATMHQTNTLAKYFGVDNPLNVPGQFHQGLNTALGGYAAREPATLGGGLLSAAMAIGPGNLRYARHYSRLRGEVAPRVIQEQLSADARPKGTPRPVWQSMVERPWRVGQSRFATEADAQQFAAKQAADPIERGIHDAVRGQMSPIEATEAFLASRGLPFTRSDARSTSSRYLYVSLPDGNTVKLRFADHSRDAGLGGVTRTHTKTEWDLPSTFAGENKARIASAHKSLDDYINALAKPDK